MLIYSPLRCEIAQMEIISVEAIIAEQLLFFLSIQILCKSVMWVGKYIVERCSARE